jgi:hypothetical protein
MFDSLKSALSPGWVGVALGLLTTILGVGLSLVLYGLGKPRMALKWVSTRHYLVAMVGEEVPGLEIRFHDKAVPQVLSTNFVVWNDGNQTIDGRALETLDHLRFNFADEDAILDTIVIACSRDVVNPQMSLPAGEKDVIVKFDYLDAGDGFVVQFLHTHGKPGPWPTGAIKGVPEGPQQWQPPGSGSFLANVASIAFSLALAAVAALLISLLTTGGLASRVNIFLLTVAFIFPVISVFPDYSRFRSRVALKRLHPKLRAHPVFRSAVNSLSLS